ncbi:MAG: AbrB/MazE/SpoVT family DNA-binding domain-containing protein [Acidobacteriota bacterium]|nr:AbrB/MazE/SpoVT family DNA-binding domain-containing protein [Gammaproteobacteria bacterium]MDE2971003.1 AbrB/MazE/SpoVT family DNA-binding domain-containing protein [Acidobacteriota bacterium]
MGARTTVSRWGASLAIRIPKPVAEQWGVREGAVVEIVPRRDEVILRKRRYDLKDLVAAITDDNLQGEVDWGAAEGAEAW